MSIHYVYCYLKEDGTPYYVGKGSGNRAWAKHANVDTPSCDRIIILAKDLEDEEALRLEKKYIAEYGRADLNEGPLLNKTSGGQRGSLGIIRSDEYREKQRIAQSGKNLSEEHKKKISEMVKGELNPFFGQKHSDENKAKISTGRKGKGRDPKSMDHRSKLSEAAKNRSQIKCDVCGEWAQPQVIGRWHKKCKRD